MTVDVGLEAVISAFIRNSEISSAQYRAGQNSIEIEMIIKDCIDTPKQQSFCRQATAAIKMLHQLREKETAEIGINFNNQGNISILTLCRDVFTLTEEEIDLYVKLARLEFSNMLLRETDEAVLQNKAFNDIKNRVMQNIRPRNDTSNNIFAYRDRGKMFCLTNRRRIVI